MKAPLECFENALAYFAIAIIYTLKMFMKLTPVAIDIRLFASVIISRVGSLPYLQT